MIVISDFLTYNGFKSTSQPLVKAILFTLEDIYLVFSTFRLLIKGPIYYYYHASLNLGILALN